MILTDEELYELFTGASPLDGCEYRVAKIVAEAQHKKTCEACAKAIDDEALREAVRREE